MVDERLDDDVRVFEAEGHEPLQTFFLERSDTRFRESICIRRHDRRFDDANVGRRCLTRLSEASQSLRWLDVLRARNKACTSYDGPCVNVHR